MRRDGIQDGREAREKIYKIVQRESEEKLELKRQRRRVEVVKRKLFSRLCCAPLTACLFSFILLSRYHIHRGPMLGYTGG